MANVTLTHLSKSFGSTRVLQGINLFVTDGEFLVLVGHQAITDAGRSVYRGAALAAPAQLPIEYSSTNLPVEETILGPKPMPR